MRPWGFVASLRKPARHSARPALRAPPRGLAYCSRGDTAASWSLSLAFVLRIFRIVSSLFGTTYISVTTDEAS